MLCVFGVWGGNVYANDTHLSQYSTAKDSRSKTVWSGWGDHLSAKPNLCSPQWTLFSLENNSWILQHCCQGFPRVDVRGLSDGNTGGWRQLGQQLTHLTFLEFTLVVDLMAVSKDNIAAVAPEDSSGQLVLRWISKQEYSWQLTWARV